MSQRDQRDILASIPARRVLIELPDNFDRFVRQVIVPKFEQQRLPYQKQFAVLLLVTKEDFSDINQINEIPSS